jgi:hypothetical protein
VEENCANVVDKFINPQIASKGSRNVQGTILQAVGD